ncbi:MAG: tetratricopeptide repeat protein [Prevotella sp.]|nr:tetratricopeptide repeat protein [Prevotella sp.]
MKHIVIILFALTATSLHAQTPAVQKAAKAVFALTTYKADGTILNVTHGAYFVNADEGIAAFKPFDGAYRADIIDAAGNRADVEAIIGANDMYDICRFKLSKAGAAALQPAADATGTVWAAGYSTKQAALTPLTISSSEKFLDKYNYYIINEEINDDIAGCPILNAAGEVIGLVQQSGSSYAIHSADARFYSDLASTGLSAIDGVLKKTHIRISLPDDREQARLMLLMFDSTSDSLAVLATANDYIARFPADIDGYSAIANYEVQHGNTARASQVMEGAAKKMKDKAPAYYEYAKLIYTTVLYGDSALAGNWSLDLAEENINKAVAAVGEPVYRHLAAKIQFSKGDYAAALGLYEALTETEIAGNELYYEIAQCKSNLGASDEDVFAFVDKAVEASPQPLTGMSAPYVLARGAMLDRMGEYKRAIADYNVYDSLMNYRADAGFYYTRGKCEMNVRQYQQALNDLAHAAYLTPDATYLAELAALQLRVGQYEQALQACELSFKITTDYPDVYIVQGLALHQLQRDKEAFEAFAKARDLGDERGQEYISKYGLE